MATREVEHTCFFVSSGRAKRVLESYFCYTFHLYTNGAQAGRPLPVTIAQSLFVDASGGVYA